MTIKITKFEDDDTADILVDGTQIGWIERVYGEKFASASSRQRIKFVTGYEVVFTPDHMTNGDAINIATLPEARAHVKTFLTKLGVK